MKKQGNVICRHETGESDMPKARYTYYREEEMWIGWLEEFPDYRTQGKTLTELRENLRDIYDELTSGRISCVRRVGELVVK